MQRRDRSSPLARRKPDRFVFSFAAQFLLVSITPDTDTLGHVQVYLYPQRKPTCCDTSLTLLLIVVTIANSSSVLLLTVAVDTTDSSSPYCCSSSNDKSISIQKKYRPRAIFYLLLVASFDGGLVVLFGVLWWFLFGFFDGCYCPYP